MKLKTIIILISFGTFLSCENKEPFVIKPLGDESINTNTNNKWVETYDSVSNHKILKQYKVEDDEIQSLNQYIEYDLNNNLLYDNSLFVECSIVEDTIFLKQGDSLAIDFIGHFNIFNEKVGLKTIIEDFTITNEFTDTNFTFFHKPLEKGYYDLRFTIMPQRKGLVENDSLFYGPQILIQKHLIVKGNG